MGSPVWGSWVSSALGEVSGAGEVSGPGGVSSLEGGLGQLHRGGGLSGGPGEEGEGGGTILAEGHLDGETLVIGNGNGAQLHLGPVKQLPPPAPAT